MAKEKQGFSALAKFGLAVYIIVCLATFLYLRFPYDALSGKLEQELSAAVGKPIELGHVSSVLPLGIRADGLTIDGKSFDGVITVRYKLLPLFAGKLSFGYSLEAAEGQLKGNLSTPVTAPGSQIELNLNAENFDMAGFATLAPELADLSGLVSGKVILNMDPRNPHKAEGDVTLNWINGQIPLRIPNVPMDAMPFEMIGLQAHMDGKGSLLIEQAETKGIVAATMNGKVRLYRRLTRSRINISGEIKMDSAMKSMLGVQGVGDDPVKFNLNGTVDNPRTRFTSR